MYESPQKKNSSWTPTTVQKKGKSPSKLGHFSIQPKPNQSSTSSQEIGEYSRDSADRLTANVMRGIQAKKQEEAEGSTLQRKSESPWAPTFEPPPPLPESPASKLKGAFAPVSKNPIQRQCAECAKEEEQKGEERKDLEETGIQTKLTVGAPGDSYEQEADRVASQVMLMSAPADSSASVQRQLDTNHPHHPHQIWKRAQSIKPVMQRQIDPRVQMREMIQRAHQIDGNQVSSVIPKLHSPDPIHQGMVDDYRRLHGLPPGGMDKRGNQVGPTDAQIKYRPSLPLTQLEIEQHLEVEVISLANGADSLLQGDYVRTALAERAQNSDLLRAFNDAVQQVGQDEFYIQMKHIEQEARSIIHLLKNQFDNEQEEQKLQEANRYNLQIRNGRNPAVIHQAQYFLGIDLVSPPRNGQEIGLNKFIEPLSIAVANWQQKYINKAEEIKVDDNLNIEVNGKLTPDTVAAMTLNGLNPSKDEWAERDQQEYKDIRAEERSYQQRVSYNPDSIGTQRLAIVELAKAQIGKVYAKDRGDGSKYGWQRIARYYEVAFAGLKNQRYQPARTKAEERGEDAQFKGQRTNEAKINQQIEQRKEELALEGKELSPEEQDEIRSQGIPKERTDLAEIKEANVFSGNRNLKKQRAEIAKQKEVKEKLSEEEIEKIKEKYPRGAWSWCGIFLMWAIRTVTGKGVWYSSGPVGIGTKKTNDNCLANAKPGDILAVKKTKNQYNHFAMLAREVSPDAQPSDKIETIEGNVDSQAIVYSKRWTVDDIYCYYPAVEDTPPPVTAPTGELNN